MTIFASCQECGRSYRLRDDQAGSRLKCANCPGTIDVPALEDSMARDSALSAPADQSQHPARSPAPSEPAASSGPRYEHADEPSETEWPSWTLPAILVGGVLALCGVGVALWVMLDRGDQANNNIAEFASGEPQARFFDPDLVNSFTQELSFDKYALKAPPELIETTLPAMPQFSGMSLSAKCWIKPGKARTSPATAQIIQAPPKAPKKAPPAKRGGKAVETPPENATAQKLAASTEGKPAPAPDKAADEATEAPFALKLVAFVLDAQDEKEDFLAGDQESFIRDYGGAVAAKLGYTFRHLSSATESNINGLKCVEAFMMCTSLTPVPGGAYESLNLLMYREKRRAVFVLGIHNESGPRTVDAIVWTLRKR